jgi:sugar lactone lactonase YvrE
MNKVTLRSTSFLATSLAAMAASTVLASSAYAGLASPSATLYVANGGDNTVEAFIPAGTGSLFASNALNNPFGLAFDSAGNLYVSSFSGTTIEKFTPAGVGSVFASGLNEPSGLAFDSAGNLYVASYGANSIEKFTPAGVGSVFASSGLDGPTGLAFDSVGNLYAANYNNNTVEKFDSSGNGSVFASSGLNDPSGVAIDGADNVYVSNFGGSTVEKFTPAGVGSVFASGLSKPTGLAFDSATNLYIANNANNTIDEVTPAGVGTVFAATGLNLPLLIAFAPPPLTPPSGALPELEDVQSALTGLSVTSARDKYRVALAIGALREATEPANWVNNSQPTPGGGFEVFGGIFFAMQNLEVLLWNDRTNASMTVDAQSLVQQLIAAASDVATTAIADNPTSNRVGTANHLLAQGHATANPGAAIVDYYLAWAVIVE